MRFNFNKLEQAWKNQGYSRKYIADYIGVTTESLYQKSKGKRTPELSVTQYAVICDLLEKDMKDFVKEDEQ